MGKQVEHLSEEQVFDLEEQGEKMIAEINEKKIVLEGKAKQQLEDLLDLAKVLKADSDERAAQFRKEAEDIKSKELPFDFNKGCANDEDCTEGTFCYPVDKALQTVLQAFGDIEEYELIAKKAKISGNECVPKFSKETIFFELGNILSLFNEKKEKIVQKIESKKEELEQKGVNTSSIDVSFVQSEKTEQNIIKVVEVVTSEDYDTSKVHDAPQIRSLSRDSLSVDPLALMILSQRGNGEIDTQSLMMSMMMAGSGASGDNSLTSNPLLLMAMLDSGDDSSATDLLLMTTLLGGDSSGLMSNPLLLTTLLGGDLDQNTLLPLMISQSGNGEIDPLLLVSLIGGGDNLVNDPLMLLSLIGNDIDPATILLLSGETINAGQDGDQSTIDPIMLLALTGGLGGEGGLDPIMLMLLTQGDSNIDLITLLALTGGLGGEGGLDPITLMLLTQGDSKVDPLMLMLLSGGNVDPITLMLLSGSSANAGDEPSPINPIMLLALTGGLGGEGKIDPLTLMLLTQGNGNLDPITLMLLTQGEGGIDPITLLLLSGDQTDSSNLLPFLLMSGSENDGDNSLLLFMLMNMQASS